MKKNKKNFDEYTIPNMNNFYDTLQFDFPSKKFVFNLLQNDDLLLSNLKSKLIENLNIFYDFIQISNQVEKFR